MRHLPRKGGEGELCIGLLLGEKGSSLKASKPTEATCSASDMQLVPLLSDSERQ